MHLSFKKDKINKTFRNIGGIEGADEQDKIRKKIVFELKYKNMYEHKIIKLGFMFSKDDEEVFTIDESKWFRSVNPTIKAKNKPIFEETDFMTFDEVEIYINSMEKDGWLFQSIKPFKRRNDEARFYYAFFKKSINK